MNLTEVISRDLTCKFPQIQKGSVSGYCLHYIFKICQIAAGISMIRQFHEFSKFNSWRVFAIWFTCARALRNLPVLVFCLLRSSLFWCTSCLSSFQGFFWILTYQDKNKATTEKADKKTRQNVECYWQFASNLCQFKEYLKIKIVKRQVNKLLSETSFWKNRQKPR